MFWIDPVYFWWVFIPTMLLSLGVQFYLKATFKKWGQVPNASKANGQNVARLLFDRTALEPIPVQSVAGSLSDHYDPGANVVRLSDPIGKGNSVASLAVTAHELGHVQQYQTGSGLIKMRSALLPALQFSPTLSYICIMFGLIFEMTGLMWLGVLFFGLMVIFSLLTLPVEFDASRRGLKLLEEARLLESPQDAKGARQMLTAAGLTYLAAAITSVLQLLYYVSMVRRSQ